MFRWLMDRYRRWRRNRARFVFRFFDGTRTRSADPYMVYRFLDQHPTFKWEHIEDVDHEDGSIAGEAADITIAAARQAFGIPEFDGVHDSLTAAEVLAVVREYGWWLDSAKKKLGPGSISSSRSAGSPSDSPEARKSTTNLSSAAS